MLVIVNEVVSRGPAGRCAAGGGLSRALVSAFRERSPVPAPPPSGAGDDLPAGHPLAPVLPLLHDTLLAVADETGHRMVVTDAQGRVLWREGGRGGPRRPRTRAARPVHDPATGEVVGAVDVTGPAHRFHPTTLALVDAAAQLAEAHLAARLAVRRAVARASVTGA
jgi:hypothetical protein